MYYKPLTSTNGFNSLRKKVLAEKKCLGRNYDVYVWEEHSSPCNNVAGDYSMACVIESGDPSDLSRTSTFTQLRHLLFGENESRLCENHVKWKILHFHPQQI